MESSVLSGLIICICLTTSFLLGGMEAGIFALNRLRLRQKMRAGDKSAKLLLGYLEKPEKFLWTILVGYTLSNFTAVGMVAAALYNWLGGSRLWFLLDFSLFVFLLYTFGDLLPKMLFQLFPDRFCLALAHPFRFLDFALSPLVSLVTWLAAGLLRWTGGQAYTGRLFGSREELRLIMQESSQGFSSTERSMINRVLDFQNLMVRQATIPLEKVTIVSAQAPMSTVLELCREKGLTRLLVREERQGQSRVVGLVSLKNVLYATALDPHSLAGQFIKPALYVDEGMRLEEALRRMQRGGQRLAVVLSRDRRELGVISLQDILKAIFGEVNL